MFFFKCGGSVQSNPCCLRWDLNVPNSNSSRNYLVDSDFNLTVKTFPQDYFREPEESIFRLNSTSVYGRPERDGWQNIS